MADAQKKKGSGLFSRITSFLSFILITGVLLVGLYFALRRGPYRPVEALPDSGILDMHVHTAGLGLKGSGIYVNPELKENYRYSIFMKAFGVTEEQLRDQGDVIVLDRLAKGLRESKYVSSAIVLAMDGYYVGGELSKESTQFYIPNDFLIRELAQFPELEFGASVNPNRKDALEELDRVAAAGTRIIKWIPSIMGIDPADQSLLPFYERMKSHGLVLLSHTGNERSFPNADDELADPLNLRFPLRLGLTVIAAHVATTGENDGQDNVTRLRGMMSEYPNLYADVSSLTQVNKISYLGRILDPDPENPFIGRLVYGSDMPLINTLLVSPYFLGLFLSPQKLQELVRTENAWDQDILLKQAIGFPQSTFVKINEILKPKGAEK